MTAPSLRKPCPECSGRGVVPRERRRLVIDGVSMPDPWDTRTEEICSRCLGSGSVPDPGPAADEPKAQAANDHGDCCI